MTLSKIGLCYLGLSLFSHAATPSSVLITPDDPISIQRGIDAAAAAGVKKVVIPPGVYRLPETGNVWHLHFQHLHNLEIEATGAVLYFQGRNEREVMFEDCDGVTFRGATLTRDVPPFSQGKVQAIAADHASITVRIDPGYPADIDDPRYFPRIPVLNAYSAGTHQLKPGVPDLYTADTRRWPDDVAARPVLDRLGPGLFRFHLRETLPQDVPLAVGDPVAWRGFTGGNLRLHECARMRIENVTLTNGAGFGFHESRGQGGNQWINCTITYAPPPPGATEPPLLANGCDGFHSTQVRQGPLLENCHFEGLDDDQVNIHGFYSLVVEGRENKVILDCRDAPFGEAGDHIRFYDRNGVLEDEAALVGLRPLPGYVAARPSGPVSAYFSNRAKASYVELTVDHPVKTGAWATAINADMTGQGFILRNSVFRDSRGHGLLIRAGDGLIEGCTVEGTSSAGIFIGPEMSSWNEGDYAYHLVVRGNTLRRVAIGSSKPNNGSLTVGGFEYGRIVPSPGGHRDILIENNSFEDDPGTNLAVTSTVGVKIRNNRFIRPMQAPALIWLRQDKDVEMTGNVVWHPGPAIGTLLDDDDSAAKATLQKGIVLETLAPGK